MSEIPDRLKTIKHVILVMSGKGGVGKSTVAVQLALGLKNNNYKVGLLDVDLCGPSIPTMLNIEGKSVYQCTEGWVPVYVDEEKNLSVMSIAFFLQSRNDAVIWRGPKKNAMISQFLKDVYWSELDYLIIDTPPGTSDEHLSIVQSLKQYNPDGAILVTTPQAVSVGDVRREITFCKKTSIPIIGIIENMSGFTCPHCSECSNIFSKGGGENLAQHYDIPFLGCIPLTQNIDNQTINDEQNGHDKNKESSSKSKIQLESSKYFSNILSNVINYCKLKEANNNTISKAIDSMEIKE